MGGHAASRAGRPVDVAEGSHEVRLERIDAPREESRYVQSLFLPLRLLGNSVMYEAVIVALPYVAGHPRKPITKILRNPSS
jgi:hypothetical protein